MPAYRPYTASDAHAYACGVFPCLELLDSPVATTAVILPERDHVNAGLDRIRALATARGLPIIAGDRLLRRLAGKDNCLAIGVFRKPADRLAQDADHLVLEEPADAGNLGTIMRTALGFSVRDLAIIGDGVDHEQPKVIRAAMGARFHLRVERFADGAAYGAAHRRPLYAFMSDGATDLRDLVVERPCGLVFGNEARGLDTGWARRATPVRIAHGDGIDSLNLAIAVGIGLWEVGRGTGAR